MDVKSVSQNVISFSKGSWEWYLKLETPYKLEETPYKITGKYLFFSADRELLIGIIVEELEGNGFHQAKIPMVGSKPSTDYVLCLYYKDDSRKRELAGKYGRREDVKYRYWKNDEDTLAGKYSQTFLQSLPSDVRGQYTSKKQSNGEENKSYPSDKVQSKSSYTDNKQKLLCQDDGSLSEEECSSIVSSLLSGKPYLSLLAYEEFLDIMRQLHEYDIQYRDKITQYTNSFQARGHLYKEELSFLVQRLSYYQIDYFSPEDIKEIGVEAVEISLNQPVQSQTSHTVSYNKNLQQDLLKKKYSLKDIRKIHPRAYEAWSKDEDERLRQRYEQGVTINNLSIEFERQPSAICSRLKKMSLLY